MTETCRVRRPTGTTSGPKGEDVQTYAAQDVYAGKCRVQDRDVSPAGAESGSSTADVLKSQVHVPVSQGPFMSGDVVFMNGSTAPTWRILAPHVKTDQTAERLPVERVS